MNVITDTWRQLIRRKLWPVALLLIGGLVAVPLVLAKEPAAPTVTPTARTASKDTTGATIVTLADASAEPERRRVLGATKDPFEPAPLPKAKKSKKSKKAEATPTPTSTPTHDTGGGSSGGGSQGPPESAPPSSPEPTATPEPTVPKYTIKVNFGPITGDPAPALLERLEPLPNDESPVLVYEGVEDGGKVAVFSIPGTVAAEGDGTCDPDPASCSTLKLRAGDTEFITVSDTDEENAQPVQYQLELVKIYTKKTAVSDTGVTPASDDPA
jgi:hypothetical protein